MRCAEPLQRLEQRIVARLSVGGAELTLQRRNLYILPSGFGGLWLCGSAVLYVVGINSRSNGPVLLSHLLLALFLLSLFLTHRNLQGLKLRTGEAGASCADEAARVPLLASSRRARASLQLRWLNGNAAAPMVVNLSPGTTPISVPWQPPGRGLHQPGRLQISTTAPLGLLRCWSIWAPPLQLAIAPARRPGPVALQAAGRSPDQRRSGLQAGGSDQFRELTPLRPEEGLQRAAWKTAAKGQGLQAKRFDTEEASERWLTPAAGLPQERALEHVCESFCRAIGQGDVVGLALPGGISLAPGSGRQQLQRGLQALAAVAPASSP